MSEHDTTMPWLDHQFIKLWNGSDRPMNVCYRASRDRILRVAMPGRRSWELGEFMAWATARGYKLDLPLRLHTDVA